MEKRFYFILLSVFCISALLLGFSFSKESGTNSDAYLNEVIDDEFRVVYSNQEINKEIGNEIVVSIINKASKDSDFYLEIMSSDNMNENLVYSINDEEKKNSNTNKIFLDTLASFGENGDHGTYKLKFYNEGISLKVKVVKENKKILSNFIMDCDETYKDVNGNFYYYGRKVNNFIKYNDQLYQIFGLVNGSVKIVTSSNNKGRYIENDNYLTKDDYFKTLDSKAFEENSLQDSWLMNQGFWLKAETEKYAINGDNGLVVAKDNDLYSYRYVEKIGEFGIVTSGDGTMENPLEVTYDSK